MSNIFTKVKVGKAADGYNKFNLTHDHMLTTDFGQIFSVNNIDCLIGDKFKINCKQFGRVAPMVFPTYGDVGMRLISCFVPYYLVGDDVESYMAGLKQYAGRAATGRYITRQNLDVLFYGSAYSSSGTPSGLPYLKEDPDYEIPENPTMDTKKPPYIFLVIRPDGNTRAYRANYAGKYLLKVLRTLGYDISGILDFTQPQGNNFGTRNGNYRLNALPLLCYMRAYADLMLPTTLYQSSPLLKYLHDVKAKNEDVVQSDGVLILQKLREVIPLVMSVYYDSDYFTSAWQDSNSPISNLVSSIDELDVQYGNANLDIALNTATSGRTETWLGENPNVSLSAQQLRFLRSFDNFVRRNNLVGYREYNAIYSRFGIKPSQMRSNYTQLIDIRNMPLTVGDVTATAQTEDTKLGSYAGKGFTNGDNHIEFECKDFGFFIQFAHLYVKPVYFQGFRKHCLKNNAFDHYQPEFDGVGSAPISRMELVNNSSADVYGWTERYNEYRFSLDQITGDFANDEQMYAWHTGRIFDTYPTAQTDSMLKYIPDDNGNYEFDRIFSTQNVDNPFDHFYQTWHFDIEALRQLKQIGSVQNLGVGDIVLDKSGSI